MDLGFSAFPQSYSQAYPQNLWKECKPASLKALLPIARMRQ